VIGIALVQLQLQKNKTEAIKHTLKLLSKVGSSDSDIVCLPESWYTQNSHFETEFDKITDVPKEYNMAIIPGAFVERRNNNNNDNNCNNALQISTPVITRS
jgi:predicted amidohydrolase